MADNRKRLLRVRDMYGREGQDIRALADENEDRLTFAAGRRRAAFT